MDKDVEEIRKNWKTWSPEERRHVHEGVVILLAEKCKKMFKDLGLTDVGFVMTSYIRGDDQSLMNIGNLSAKDSIDLMKLMIAVAKSGRAQLLEVPLPETLD